MYDYTAPTRTADEIANIAARAAYWNNEGRTDASLLEDAYTAAAQYGLTEDTMNTLMDTAWDARTGEHYAYIVNARKIINAA